VVLKSWNKVKSDSELGVKFFFKIFKDYPKSVTFFKFKTSDQKQLIVEVKKTSAEVLNAIDIALNNPHRLEESKGQLSPLVCGPKSEQETLFD